MTLGPIPFAQALDEFLHDVVRAIHTAVDRGIATLKTDPAETDRALTDCEDMIDTVMKGQVQEWIGGEDPSRR